MRSSVSEPKSENTGFERMESDTGGVQRIRNDVDEDALVSEQVQSVFNSCDSSVAL